MDHLAAHILVTGGGAPGAVGILKALKTAGYHNISCCDVRPNVAGSLLSTDFFQLPYGNHPSYAEKLLHECSMRNIEVILPITTKELVAISQLKDPLADLNCKAIVSPESSLKIANNKGALYAHLEKSGIAVPKYKIAKNLSEFNVALEALNDESILVFKPCESNGSRGFRIIHPKVDAFDLWLNQKPSNAYTSIENAKSLMANKVVPPVLVSEYLEGDEYSVDCLMKNGEIQLIIPRKRIKINNGISVEGIIENNSKIIDYCSQILGSLALDGPIGIQVKYHKDQPLILEINPRLQGSSTACMGAGINLAQLAVESAFDFPLKYTQNDIKWNTHFVRHYEELYF